MAYLPTWLIHPHSPDPHPPDLPTHFRVSNWPTDVSHDVYGFRAFQTKPNLPDLLTCYTYLPYPPAFPTYLAYVPGIQLSLICIFRKRATHPHIIPNPPLGFWKPSLVNQLCTSKNALWNAPSIVRCVQMCDDVFKCNRWRRLCGNCSGSTHCAPAAQLLQDCCSTIAQQIDNNCTGIAQILHN